MPVALPASSKSNSTPASARTRFIASRLFAIGVRLPFSKSRTVESATLARFARSSWLQSSHARAARLCSGDNMTQKYGLKLFLSTPTKIVDIVDIGGYVLSQRKSLRLANWHSISYFRQQLGPCPCALFIRAAKTRLTRRFAGCAGPKLRASRFARAAAA